MADTRMMLEALECLISPLGGENCDECGYRCSREGFVQVQRTLVGDLVDYLKAKEPHLVTIADYENNPNVDNDGNLAVWRESRHFPGVAYHEDGWVVLSRDRVEGWFNSEAIRFWTSRPTDEQREAIPWGD